MRRRSSSRLLGAGIVALLLVGCQSPQAAPSSSPSSAEPTTTSPSPEPSPEPSPSPSPSPSEPPSPEPEPLPSAEAPTAAGSNTILAPAEGATVSGPRVVISGTGTAFEATLLWRVIDTASSQVVAEDFTMAGSMGDIGPFEIELELEPGVYQAEVWAPDMSDGDSGGPERIDLVAVTFVVE